MNILIFSWRGPGHPNAGGAETSTHEHAKGWVKAGHSVTLFTSSYEGAKKEEVIDGVLIKRRGSQVLGVHWEALKWYLFAKHPKYDLVIDQFHGIPFFTPFYVRGEILAFIHEVAKEVWKTNFSFLPALVGEISEPWIFKLFYKKIPFMTVSDSTRQDLITWGIAEKNISVIHNGINVPKMKIPPKENKKTIIYLGSLSKDKGIEDALEVFSLLKNENIQFWVVGKSHPRYLKFLKENCDSRVKFWGYVAETKKFELLARAHLLINPSVREGWGLVVIEAARMGTPTVAYHVAGLKDSVIDDKTGILCKQEVAALAKELQGLLQDEKRLKTLSQQAISWSNRFTWDKSVRKSLALINKLIDKR